MVYCPRTNMTGPSPGGKNMDPMERARLLCADIRESEEYRDYARCKSEISGDSGIMSLLNEYTRLQMEMQLAAASGSRADDVSVQRFSGLSALLYNDPRTSAYLLAQLRLQKLAADILQLVTAAADMELPR